MPTIIQKRHSLKVKRNGAKPDTAHNMTSAEKAASLRRDIARVEAKLAEYQADKNERGITKSKEILANLYRSAEQIVK